MQTTNQDGLYTLVSRLSPETSTNQSLIALVEQEMSTEPDYKNRRIGNSTIATYINNKILLRYTSKKLHATQVQRVKEDSAGIPPEIRKRIVSYFKANQSESTTANLISHFEGYFITEPLNRVWWEQVQRQFSELEDSLDKMYNPYLSVHNSDGNIGYRGPLFLAVKKPELLNRILKETAQEVISNHKSGKEWNKQEVISNEIDLKDENSFVFGVPWQMDSRWVPCLESPLGEVMKDMRLVLCCSYIRAINCMERLSKNSDGYRALQEKIEDTKEKTEALAHNKVRPLVDKIMINWIGLHRGNPSFKEIYDKLLEKIKPQNQDSHLSGFSPII